MELSKSCEQCGDVFVYEHYRKVAKFCSRTCSAKSKKAPDNVTCTECSKTFHRKPFQLKNYKRNLGFFCSHVCTAKAKSKKYLGEMNPNYKGKNVDSDGYRMYVPNCLNELGFRGMKLHQAVCCEILGISAVPKNKHVHHRDCDINNNEPTNLSVLDVHDHKWLHKQYGVATLWAFCRGKVSLNSMVSWSDDHDRAKRLLPLDVTKQSKELKQ